MPIAVDRDEIRIVQFLHPGLEHHSAPDGFKAWNDGPHRRKFLQQSGACIADLKDKQRITGKLHFWAEWEPESELRKRFDRSQQDTPRFLFQPYWRPRRNYAGLANTDPFVFGDRFYYCICQQRGKMKYLARGSIILFGSCRRNQFVLDTVFVVAGWQEHNASNYRRLPVSEAYRAVSLAPLYDWDPGCKKRDGGEFDDETFRLYEGATFDNPYSGMFSFFPCLPAADSDGFPRPSIRLPSLVNPRHKQGRKQSRPMTLAQVSKAWQSVTRQVLEQGLHLGIYTQMPSKERKRTAIE